MQTAQYDNRSPFADPSGRQSTRPSVPFSKSSSSMRKALEESVTIRPVANGRQASQDAYGQDDDILASYTDRSTSRSPTKERSSRSKGDEITPVDGSSKGFSVVKKKDTPSKGKKSEVPFDVIDKLDISGLYGGGAFHRHDGPYAAATASRNKGPRAPMAAFDPSALAPPSPASRNPRPNNNLSARAQATLAAMDHNGLPANGEHPGMGRSMSDSSVSMGFPSAGSKGKGAQLIEIYGVRDNEAWEDFGTTRFDPVSGPNGFSSSRESVVPAGVSKEDRMGRAQSIWDIEATLREGKPVGQAPPPPVPVLPAEFSSNSGLSPDKPKRSKSLASRFRQGRRNPNNPMDEGELDDGRAAGSVPLNELDNGRVGHHQPSASLGGGNYSSYENEKPGGDSGVRFNTSQTSPTRTTREGPPPAASARFAGGASVSGVHSHIQEGETERSALGRRPSVMQRLLGKKAK